MCDWANVICSIPTISRPKYSCINHSTDPVLDRLDSPRQQSLQLIDRLDPFSPEIPRRSCLGDASIVRGRREADVEFFIRRFRRITVWMDQERRSAGGVPPCFRIRVLW